MNGNVPGEYRMLFPLAPVFAVMALSLVDIPVCVQGMGRDGCECPSNRLTPTCSSKGLCCETMPTRSFLMTKNRPKFSVKYVNVGRGAVDYDAGHQMVVLNCTFNDQCAEYPVVGISQIGQIVQLQTDAGTVVEGGSGFGVISPTIRKFTDVPFVLHASIPLATKSLTAVKGAITVLRATERAELSWREPFASHIGNVRSAGDFELRLSKCTINNDLLVVEWACKMPVERAAGATPWLSRLLKVTLVCADKTVVESEVSSQSATMIQRTFRLNKKFPVSLEMSFASVLKMENLHFDLAAIVLDGSSKKRVEVPSLGQDF